jgi:hypothetical protein
MRGTLRAAAIAAAFLTALPPGLVAEDLTVVSTMTSPRGTARTQTQYLSATRLRTSDGERDTIVDIRSGKITLLNHRRKEYSETSLDELRAFLDQLDAAMAGRPLFDEMMGSTATVTVLKGAGGRRIAGYDTQQYTLTLGDTTRVEVWTAEALPPPLQYFDARKILYATMGPMGRRFDRIFDEMKKIKGLPLATAIDYRMRMTRRELTTEATEVRKGPIPDSAFAPPADYKKVESPFAGRREARPGD